MASAALVELSTVSSAVERWLAGCGRELDVAVVAVAEAQEHAAAALAVAASGGVTLSDDGTLATALPVATPAMAADQVTALDELAAAGGRAEALAALALDHGGRVLQHLLAAGEALAPLSLVGAPGPADFAALARHALPVGPVIVPPPADSRDADGVAVWWAGLTAAQHRVLIRSSPQLVGSLDGLPAWARDAANRRLLAEEMRRPSGQRAQDTAQAVYADIAAREATGQTVQLHQFDLAEDLVGLAVGDLDTATEVAVLVPGIRTTPADDVIGLSAAADRIATATRAAAPAAEVAVLVWLGYRAPGLATAWAPFAAARGGPALDRALDGLAANRNASPPRTTVVAHSYGTVVVERAAHADGDLAADAVVLLGSPGIDEGTADGLEADAVFDAATPADPISYLGWFGEDTWDRSWGSTALPVDPGQGHSEYLDGDRPTLAAVGEVVAGTRTP